MRLQCAHLRAQCDGSPCLDFPTETYAELLVVGEFGSDQLECPEALPGRICMFKG
jgi:hypothetical protein